MGKLLNILKTNEFTHFLTWSNDNAQRLPFWNIWHHLWQVDNFVLKHLSHSYTSAKNTSTTRRPPPHPPEQVHVLKTTGSSVTVKCVREKEEPWQQDTRRHVQTRTLKQQRSGHHPLRFGQQHDFGLKTGQQLTLSHRCHLHIHTFSPLNV